MSRVRDYEEARLRSLKRITPAPKEPEPMYVDLPREQTEDVLPIYKVVSDYDHYRRTGTCILSDDAYSQCVAWRQGGSYGTQQRARLPRYGSAHKQNYGTYREFKTVTKINPSTGMPFREQVETTVQQSEPSYGHLQNYTPGDLYRGSTTLPVSITSTFGHTRQGVKVVKDDPYSDKK